jgi:hypothetical protein
MTFDALEGYLSFRSQNQETLQFSEPPCLPMILGFANGTWQLD